ncbi:MAG: 30S ribosomal protein S8 [Nitrospira sp.]|nr:30S ribosomal protein S8 [Nitrospira sp.]
MVTDPIADLLIRIQNAARRGQEAVSIPASRLKTEILKVMQAEGFIGAYEKTTADGHSVLKVRLRYINDGQPVITGMRRISRPGRRVYAGKQEMQKVMGGMGLAIVSNSKGIMTDQASRRANLGGEVLCHIW